MIEVVRKRADVDADVILMVQFEDGSRLPGTFKSTATLMEILQRLCPGKCDDEHLVVIYMRTEVSGDAIQTTTLKSLGLTSGRAIIRLMKRNPESIGM